MLFECYNEALDYYTNADVVKTGDIEAIGAWLVEQEHVRDNDFDCIMIYERWKCCNQ